MPRWHMLILDTVKGEATILHQFLPGKRQCQDVVSISGLLL